MAFDVTAIRKGLDDVLASIPDLRHSAYQPDTVNPPHAWVHTGEPFLSYDEAFAKGQVKASFEIRVALSTAGGWKQAQALLDTFLSSGTGQASSVIDAVAATRTVDGALGGVCDDARVWASSGVQEIEAGALSYLGATLYVTVLCPRT